MGRTYLGNSYKIKMYLGNTPIHRMYLGNERIYPNAGMVTYHVDTNVTYTEEVDIDESILNPSTFTPSKSGWTFVGWRKDTAANGSVLSNEVMTGDDVTLYAVFRQTITLSYNGNGATGGSTASQSGTQYYNNGNVANPSFRLNANGFSNANHNFLNWAMGSTGGTRYNPGDTVALSSNTVFYAMWKLKPLVLYPSSFNMGIVSQTLNYTNGDNGTASCGNVYVKWSFSDVAYYGCEIAAASTNALDLRGYTRMTIDIEGEEYKEVKVGFGTSRGAYNCGYATSDGGSASINISSSAVYLYVYGKFSENTDYKTARSCRLAVNSITFS